MLFTWVPKKGAHQDDDGHTQASVRWADRVSPSPLLPRFAPPLVPVIMRTRVGVNGGGRVYVSLWYRVYADDNFTLTRRQVIQTPRIRRHTLCIHYCTYSNSRTHQNYIPAPPWTPDPGYWLLRKPGSLSTDKSEKLERSLK